MSPIFRNLPDTDVFSKSDPMCVVYLKTLEKDRWQEICRTEVIQNSLNPDFTTKVSLLCYFFLGYLRYRRLYSVPEIELWH